MPLFRPRSLMTWHGRPRIRLRRNRPKLGFPSRCDQSCHCRRYEPSCYAITDRTAENPRTET
eukprot:4691965-Pyramimonas_sp.AAC.1